MPLLLGSYSNDGFCKIVNDNEVPALVVQLLVFIQSKWENMHFSFQDYNYTKGNHQGKKKT